MRASENTLATATKDDLHLLRIPVELRLEIYNQFLDQLDGRDSYAEYRWRTEPDEIATAFASTCHQIRRGFLPILLGHKELYFINLDSLMKQARGDIAPRMLSLVRKFRLDLSPACYRSIGNISRGFKEEHYLKMVTEEHSRWVQGMIKFHSSYNESKDLDPRTMISATWEAFQSLKHITSLRLNFWPTPDQYFAEQNLIVEMIGLTFHELKHLKINAQDMPLDPLGSLSQLEALTFSGYSISTPGETLKILRELKHLESLNIKRSDLDREKDDHPENDCVTAEVLGGLNPLKHFKMSIQFRGRAPRPNAAPHCLTPAAMLALHKHKDTLMSFKLRYIGTVSKATLEAMLDFLATSRTLVEFQIRIGISSSCTALDFPSFYPQHLECGEMLVAEALILPELHRCPELRFVGGPEFEYPSVATPGPGLQILRYWSTLHGELSRTLDSDSDSDISTDGMEAPEPSEGSTPSN